MDPRLARRIRQIDQVVKNYADEYAKKRRKKYKKIQFSSDVRNSQQCKSNTLKGLQCKKRTAKTKKCWIHLGKENNLRIKKSSIPNAGLGLYSYKGKFEKNDKIGKYTGKQITKRQLDKKYPGKNTIASYAICRGNKPTSLCVDAYKTTHGAPRFANDGKHSGQATNSKITKNFNLISTKKIPANTEILTSYGKDYWPKILK